MTQYLVASLDCTGHDIRVWIWCFPRDTKSQPRSARGPLSAARSPRTDACIQFTFLLFDGDAR